MKCVLLHTIRNLGTTGHACWCIDFRPGETQGCPLMAFYPLIHCSPKLPSRTADQNTWSLSCCRLHQSVAVITALLYFCRTFFCAFPQMRKWLQMSGAISVLGSSHRGEWFSGFIKNSVGKNKKKKIQQCLIYEAVGSALCWNEFHFVNAPQLEIIRRMMITVLFYASWCMLELRIYQLDIIPNEGKSIFCQDSNWSNWYTCVLVWVLQRV